MRLWNFLFAAWILCPISLCLAQIDAAPLAPKPIPPKPLWITAYYAGWQSERLPPSEIDFRALSHLVQFSVLPGVDGTLNWTEHGLSADFVQKTVAATHAAGKKILLCVGGANSAAGFRGAMRDETRAAFIVRLIEALETSGYDGLDLDMEPVEASDAPLYGALVRELRAGMRARDPRWLLTAAVSDSPALFAALQDQFDQINVMTYDMSGAWEGWPTWHNAPLGSGNERFPNSNRPLPSIEIKTRDWLAAGLKPGKMGLGLPFYGSIWPGTTGPNQSLPKLKNQTIDYFDVMQKHFPTARYGWDAAASVPYLSADETGSDRDFFLSFDDERSLALKIEFAQKLKLGGAIIWELGSGYRRELAPGKRDPLLQAVRRAAFGEK